MLITSLLVTHLIFAEIRIFVSKDDVDKTPISRAAVDIRRGRKYILNESTGSQGIVIVDDSEFTGTEVIEASADGYEPRNRPWPPINKPEDPIHIALPLRRRTCTYTVQKLVVERGPDGRENCRMVYETMTRECPPAGALEYRLPIAPPPPGFKYEFAFAVTRWDAERGKWAHRPYWRLVPACQQAGAIYIPAPSPCGCR